ncbi:MAG TPA: GH116 family glycosyl-hydrolase [bacterium]|nr:GH116 family glycosyl-hydrolase [bacterium]HOM27461.1 GH116 family glycosyl-hydrolase [bacterium]
MKGIKYEGNKIKQIKFLLGGIGAGNVSVEGKGSLTDWEIFNRPGKGKRMYGNFVSLRVKSKDGIKYRIVSGNPFPPFESAGGYQNLNMEGCPCFERVEFTNYFPFAIIDFSDKRLSLKITLEAFTPFIPLDYENSSLPIAVFTYRIKNLTEKELEIFLAFSIMNPVGTDGTENLNSPKNVCFGGNINIYKEIGEVKGLYLKSNKYEKESHRYGNISLFTDSKNISYKTQWEKIGWWTDYENFWREFKNGKFEFVESKESQNGETYWATLGVKENLKGKEEKEINFYLSWYFPNRINYWGLNEEVKNKILKNWYSKRFSDSAEVVKYYIKNKKYLKDESIKFAESFFSQSLPESFLATISSQFNTLRSNTFFITEDGRFYAFEGCSDNNGCCPLNCTHVYNYDFTVSYLFPNFMKSQREVDYLYNTDENGYMAFRTNIPLGIKLWQFKPAADGQMGTVLKAYREWKITGDNEFLKRIYTKLKKSVEYAWENWDKNRDGLMEGEQHNTYDVEFYRENPFTSFIYLASLKAMEEISEFMGDIDFKNECKRIYEEGRKKVIEELWNGKYFVQKCKINPLPPYQFLNGCLTSQLLGQFFADNLNLGSIVEEKYIKKTLSSILKYNFIDFSEHINFMRIYGIGNEKGVIVCSFPEGRPEIPMPYCDEVWTGEEFVIASLLIRRGKLKQAKEIIEAINNRYDGEKRNPFNHIECGYHYGRGFSAFGLILSYLGFFVDNVRKEIYFSPVLLKKELNIFFSTGTGWGNYKYSKKGKLQVVEIEILHGFIEMKNLIFKIDNVKNRKIEIKVDDIKKDFDFVLNRNSVKIFFGKPELILKRIKVLIK